MASNQTRRQWIKAAAAGTVGIAGLSGCTDDSGDDDGDDGGTDTGDGGTGAEGTVSIGVIQPMSGDLEYYGDQGLYGFLTGLAYKAGEDPPVVDEPGEETIEVGDVAYELYFEDTEFVPDQAQTVAEDLVQDRGVDLLYGCSSSDSARQVIDTVTRPAEVPTIFGPSADADITHSSENCGDLVFRAHENAAMDARSGGRYVARQTDVESIYIVYANSAFGQSVADNYRAVFEEEGLDIVGEQSVDSGFSKFEGIYDEIESTGADATLGGFTFLTLPDFIRVGLQRDVRVTGGLATLVTNRAVGDVVRSVLGEDFTAGDIQDAKLGPFTTRYHWNQYDDDINSEFVETYVDTYGVVPDLFTSGSFAAASSVVQAVDSAGSTNGADIADAMRGMTVEETPKGENAYTYQRFNNQAASSMTVAELVPTEDRWADAWDAIQPGDPIEVVPAEDATTPQDDESVTCDL
ncbi:branched-chain amino acid ABC transporter substrate-binding protein [Halobacteriales archaeon QS_9_70_65]|nr:MAG: branched-chain amino acid ABC transporter substrate-binding protein [Halobacteriales archaeon QS_9_70_65]